MKLNSAEIVIIGSGLSAYGAISAAIDLNAQITIIDIGDVLPEKISNVMSTIQNEPPAKVHKSIADISRYGNDLRLGKREMPKKTVFGSKYFYKEESLAGLAVLPFSEAFGGYSVAWGAAVLPPTSNDLPNLPFAYLELQDSIVSLASRLRMPFLHDALTEYFPNYGEKNMDEVLQLSKSQKVLLDRILQLQEFDPDDVCVVGQSRLLTETSGPRSCKYCGMCSHGCIYNSIFSSSQEIGQLVKDHRVKYLSGKKVISLGEVDGRVTIFSVDVNSGDKETFGADYVFVAAGAVNSTKIAIKSFGLEKEDVVFQKTGGFVRPYFSLRKIGFDWPEQNTQANIFLEIKSKELSRYWIHSQVSTPNEVVTLGLGYLSSKLVMKSLSPLRNFFLKRLVLVMTNLHSSNGPYYDLITKIDGDFLVFDGELKIPKTYLSAERRIELKIKKKFRKIGLFAIPFTKKGVSNGPGYHIGGSMPSGGSSKLSTDSLGRFTDNSRISFVDTSVLPCIPATTIGLLAMANSYRITKSVLSGL